MYLCIRECTELQFLKKKELKSGPFPGIPKTIMKKTQKIGAKTGLGNKRGGKEEKKEMLRSTRDPGMCKLLRGSEFLD